MSLALTFKFITTEFLVFTSAFSCDTNNFTFQRQSVTSYLGPKYRVFVNLSHAKLFLWVKIFRVVVPNLR